MEEHQFQFLARQEDGVDEQDFHTGFVEAAGPAATAAVRVHMDQSVPIHQAVACAQWDMVDLKAFHDHLRCSEGTDQEDIQGPERISSSNYILLV